MDNNTEKTQPSSGNPAIRRPYGDPADWFESVYTSADNDIQQVPWTRQSNAQFLLPWLAQHKGHMSTYGQALVIGCGLGDDAETLAQQQQRVTAFDFSPQAIAWCRQRFPTSRVDYQVADLFQLPATFQQAFKFVFESRTIQSLPPELHTRAIEAIADCVAPGGTLLLICYARDADEPTAGPPWFLTRSELDHFLQHGLLEISFQDQVVAGVRHFIAAYKKGA
ncbi:methyltransferase type 12 [Dictyobacter vulcani]|uniref:Methyltransferase type 12 n=1 Tax=Dictyobacter vulcani TaxID=2607529 RepID=A0A5J4KWR0_9CHLR|nr:class I SAM-dependent methyltransferase [Dictyobacter vulcani]GER90569.1 methyltransferase type 12 [Dictyobacter vulcani]